MKKYSWYTNPVKVTDYLTVYQYAVDREIFLEKRKDGSTSFILIKKGTYVTRHDGGWQRYKPNLKGGHTHNHQRNALERKLNRSKDSRNLCHNVLNKGYEYKFVLNRGNLVRVKRVFDQELYIGWRPLPKAPEGK